MYFEFTWTGVKVIFLEEYIDMLVLGVCQPNMGIMNTK